MCKFVGTELKKDQYVLLTGCKVKGENALYKVIHDVANEENYSGDNGYVLNKVKLNGELKESGYTLYFYDNAGIKRDPEVKAVGLNGVEDLKEANKKLKAYLKERDNKTIVNKIEEVEEKINLKEVGKVYKVKMINNVSFSTNGWYNNKCFRKDSYYKVTVRKDNKINVVLLNKKADDYSFDTACKYNHNLDEKLTKKFIENSVVINIEKVTKESLKENITIEKETESKEATKEIKTTKPVINIEDKISNDNKKEGIENMNINLENLFENVEVKNENRLSEEDNQVIDKFRKTLADMRKNFELYLHMYRENPIYTLDKNYKTGEYENKKIMGVDSSINTFEEEFIEKVIFKQTQSLINEIYYYFKNKYNVTLKPKTHSKDYSLRYRPTESEENYNYYINVSVDDILNDIFNQLGGSLNFDDKSLQEAKEKIKKSCIPYRNEKIVTVKNKKISISDFIYYDSWGKEWGDWRNSDNEKINALFKLLTYFGTEKIDNNYTSITDKINNYNNKYIGVYEINDNILQQFKTFKNGKIELTFNTPVQALEFAKTYLGYQE